MLDEAAQVCEAAAPHQKTEKSLSQVEAGQAAELLHRTIDVPGGVPIDLTPTRNFYQQALRGRGYPTGGASPAFSRELYLQAELADSALYTAALRVILQHNSAHTAALPVDPNVTLVPMLALGATAVFNPAAHRTSKLIMVTTDRASTFPCWLGVLTKQPSDKKSDYNIWQVCKAFGRAIRASEVGSPSHPAHKIAQHALVQMDGRSYKPRALA